MSRKLGKLLRIRRRLARVAQARLAGLERVEQSRQQEVKQASLRIEERQKTGGRVCTFERLGMADDAAREAARGASRDVGGAAQACRATANAEHRAQKLYDRARADERKAAAAKEQRENDDRNGRRR